MANLLAAMDEAIADTEATALEDLEVKPLKAAAKAPPPPPPQTEELVVDDDDELSDSDAEMSPKVSNAREWFAQEQGRGTLPWSILKIEGGRACEMTLVFFYRATVRCCEQPHATNMNVMNHFTIPLLFASPPGPVEFATHW